MPWKENFLDLKTKQRSSYTRRGVLHKGNEIYSCVRSMRVSTTVVLCSFYGLSRALEERTREGLRREMMNADELGKNLTQIWERKWEELTDAYAPRKFAVDLWSESGRCSGLSRWRRGVRRWQQQSTGGGNRKKTTGEDLGRSIYKGRLTERARKTRRWHSLSSGSGASILGMVNKDKDPLKMWCYKK